MSDAFVIAVYFGDIYGVIDIGGRWYRAIVWPFYLGIFIIKHGSFR